MCPSDSVSLLHLEDSVYRELKVRIGSAWLYVYAVQCCYCLNRPAPRFGSSKYSQWERPRYFIMIEGVGRQMLLLMRP